MDAVKKPKEPTPIIHIVDRHSEKDLETINPDCKIQYWIAKGLPPTIGAAQNRTWRAYARMDILSQHYSAFDDREFDSEERAWMIAELLAKVLAHCEKAY